MEKIVTDTLKDNFFRGYLICALWSETDNADDRGGEPLDANYGLEDIDPAARAQCRAECDAFVDANKADLEEYCERRGDHPEYTAADCAGHDFWLTRNGHGAGFWDRGLGELGKRLSAAARLEGGRNFYVGDDGVLYVTSG